MKREGLLQRIRRQARVRGKRLALLREGGDHEIWQVGTTEFALPRHREINEHTAEKIVKELETEFGAKWWR